MTKTTTIGAMQEALATLHLMHERLEVNNYEDEEEPFMEDCTTAIAMLEKAIDAELK